MVSDDGINTPASFDTTPSKSVRPTKQQQQQHNPPPSLPLSSFAIGPIDPHSRCTPHEREGPHPKRFVFPGPLTHPKEGRKDIKKRKKKCHPKKLRVKAWVFAIKRTWTRASSRRSFWAQKPSSAKRSESKWKTSSFACVFFVTKVLLFEQGCAFFVKNDFVSSLRERRDKKTSFFHLSFFIFFLGPLRLLAFFRGRSPDLSLSLSLNPKSVQLYTEFYFFFGSSFFFLFLKKGRQKQKKKATSSSRRRRRRRRLVSSSPAPGGGVKKRKTTFGREKKRAFVVFFFFFFFFFSRHFF